MRKIKTRVTGIVPRQLLSHSAVKVEESPDQFLFQTMDRLYTKATVSPT